MRSAVAPLLPTTFLVYLLAASSCWHGVWCQWYDCVNLPHPPLNGHIKGPTGAFLGRIRCPKGQDIALNTREDGVLDCDPLVLTYAFDRQPVVHCLPLKRPDAFTMALDVRFTAPTTSTLCSNRNAATARVRSMLPKVDLSSFDSKLGYGQFTTSWIFTGQPFCDANATGTWLSPRVKLKVAPYRPEKSVDFYIGLAEAIRAKFFNQTGTDEVGGDAVGDGSKPDVYWDPLKGSRLDGLRVYYSRMGALLSSCANQPNTAGVDVAYHRIISCRGCPQDYVIQDGPDGPGTCASCGYNRYTRGPFSSRCLPCPPEAKWTGTRLEFIKYCVRFQADYD